MSLRNSLMVAPLVLAGLLRAAAGGTPGTLSPGVQEPADVLVFDVVESFDAKFEGDQPGHLGRRGGLGDRPPRVALGDAVYRGRGKASQLIGHVTNLRWNRAQGSLDLEFDPAGKLRIEIGDTVWLRLGSGND